MKKGKITGATLTSLVCLYLSSAEVAASAVNNIDADSVITDTQSAYTKDCNYAVTTEVTSLKKTKKEDAIQYHHVNVQDSEGAPEWIRTNFKVGKQVDGVTALNDEMSVDTNENTDNENVDCVPETLVSSNEPQNTKFNCDDSRVSETNSNNIGISNKERNKAEFQYDELGNIIGYEGLQDNVIVAEDDKLVMSAKQLAQEKWMKSSTTQAATVKVEETSDIEDSSIGFQKDNGYFGEDDNNKKTISLSDDDTLIKNAEAEMTGYLNRHIGVSALRLLVFKLKWHNQYSYDEKLDRLIGYGAAINKSNLSETTKHELIDMMCQVFNGEELEKKAPDLRRDNDISLCISEVQFDIKGNIHENEIYRLLPELKKSNVNIRKLSHNIQYINEHGTMFLNVQFHPINGDEYKAVVLAKDIKDDTFCISESNSGNQYSGNWKLSLGYSNNDFIKRGDNFEIVTVASPNSYDDVYQLFAKYDHFIPSNGDNVSFYYGYSNSDLGVISHIDKYAILAHGSAENAGIAYHKNFTYTSTKKSIFSVGFDHKHYKGGHEIELNGTNWAFNKYDVVDDSISIAYMGNQKYGNSSLGYTIGFSYGIGGDRKSFSGYRYIAEPGYLIGKIACQYINRFKNDSILVARFNAQYTKNNLLTIDQLGAGGSNTVRGFSENIANGDIGYVAGLELYTPPIGKYGRFLAFVDASSLFNNTYNIGESKKRLASVGIGYRLWNQNGWDISIDYGKCIQKEGIKDSDIQPWHFFIRKSF